MTASMNEQLERIKNEIDELKKADENDPKKTEELEKELIEQYKACKHVMDDIVIKVDPWKNVAVIHNRDTGRIFKMPVAQFREKLKVCNTTHPFQRGH